DRQGYIAGVQLIVEFPGTGLIEVVRKEGRDRRGRTSLKGASYESTRSPQCVGHGRRGRRLVGTRRSTGPGAAPPPPPRQAARRMLEGLQRVRERLQRDVSPLLREGQGRPQGAQPSRRADARLSRVL